MSLILKSKKQHWIGEYSEVGFPFDTPGDIVAVDTETTGLNPWGKVGVDRTVEPARLFIVSFCNSEGHCAMVRFRVDAFTRKVEYTKRGLDLIAKIVSNPSIKKVLANANFDKRMFSFMGVWIAGEILDCLIAFHIQKPDELSKQLKSVCAKYLDIPADDQKSLDRSVIKLRLKVNSAVKKVANNTATPEEVTLSKYSINRSEDDDKPYKSDMWLGDVELCNTYALKDAYRTMMVWLTSEAVFDEDAEKGGVQWSLFRDEQRCQEVIYRMENRGIAVNKPHIIVLEEFYNKLMVKHLQNIKKLTHKNFNPASLPDKQEAFFAIRKIKPLKYKINPKTKLPSKHQTCKGKGCLACFGTGHNPQVDSDFLASIGTSKSETPDGEVLINEKEPLAYNILHWSAAHSMHNFVSQYQKLQCLEEGNWVIHPNLKQIGTITNRLSAEKPNLQNVADDDSGKKRANIPYRPREAFIARPGCVLLLPDYSQIEIWMLALRAKAKKLLDILVTGGDTHGRIAKLVWNSDFDLDRALLCKNIDKKELNDRDLRNLKTYTNRRKRSKNLQFCKIYGGGAGRIAEMIGEGTTAEMAKAFIADYDRELPEVAEFMQKTVAAAKFSGTVENAYGWVYPINTKLAYRAVNYDIQGSAACLMKRAMNKVGDLSDTKWKNFMWPLLTIHDELMIELDKSLISRLDQVNNTNNAFNTLVLDIQKAMQADWELLGSPCPFPIGMKCTETSWAEAKEIKL